MAMPYTETTQTSSKWQDKPTVIKGDYGEEIVRKILEKKGWIPYTPHYFVEKGHAIDIIAVKDKIKFRMVECKSKAKRTFYPDTGFGLKNYYEYKELKEKYKDLMELWILFIDEGSGDIYGNTLEKLELETTIAHKGNAYTYPRVENNIIYFPLANMETIALIDNSDKDYLIRHSKRNYEYTN